MLGGAGGAAAAATNTTTTAAATATTTATATSASATTTTQQCPICLETFAVVEGESHDGVDGGSCAPAMVRLAACGHTACEPCAREYVRACLATRRVAPVRCPVCAAASALAAAVAADNAGGGGGGGDRGGGGGGEDRRRTPVAWRGWWRRAASILTRRDAGNVEAEAVGVDEMGPHVLRSLLSEDEMDKFEQLALDHAVDGDARFRRCPTPGCNGVVFLDDAEDEGVWPGAVAVAAVTASMRATVVWTRARWTRRPIERPAGMMAAEAADNAEPAAAIVVAADETETDGPREGDATAVRRARAAGDMCLARVRCRSCEREWCARCGEATAHEGRSCREFRRWLARRRRDAARELELVRAREADAAMVVVAEGEGGGGGESDAGRGAQRDVIAATVAAPTAAVGATETETAMAALKVDVRFEELVGREQWRRCPGCSAVVSKSEGELRRT
ncbi:hypothetical protein HK405_010651 [Cladochytrium tenue]|nr:hypothetical protein HK405_010651 [Cladochytrium tenue]